MKIVAISTISLFVLFMFTKSALFELNIIPTGARSAPEKKSVLFVCLCNFYFSQTENPNYFDGVTISTFWYPIMYHYLYQSLFRRARRNAISKICVLSVCACWCMLFVLFARSRITAISTDLLFLLFKLMLLLLLRRSHYYYFFSWNL